MQITPVQREIAINLQFYKAIHLTQLNSFILPDDQTSFTALPKDVIELSIEDPNRYPIVITYKDVPVGFLVLHHGAEIHSFSTNPNALLLRAFSINYKEQGKGYAKNAMIQLPLFVRTHFSDFEEIVLAVNEKNVAAYNLYLRVGFEDRGVRRVGSIGSQYILHYSLKD